MLGSCCQATCNGSLKCRFRSVYTTAQARSHSSLYRLGAGITTLRRKLNHRMDGWMTCDFTSFLTVFQSYQDDVWMIMKGCVQWNSVYGWEDFTSSEDRTRSAKSVGQRLTHWADFMVFSVSNFKMAHRSSRSILSRSLIRLNVFCISKRPCSQSETFTN